MNNSKPIHLRRDEFNTYIEENKVKLDVSEQNIITEEEKLIVERCGIDYGLIIDSTLTPGKVKKEQRKYNLILRIKGTFTLPEQAQFRSENGSVVITPYIIHDGILSQRLHIVAEILYDKKLASSPVPVDVEYMYEALRETSFNREMEEIVKIGTGFQILQIEFDENGHFKVLELDESIIN